MYTVPPEILLDARKVALEIAALTGYDARTTLRALLKGVQIIRPLKMREELRPHVEKARARLGFNVAVGA